MSGDAQPRKRKNKGKKKEDSVDENIFAPLKHSTDEIIHVQKDVGLGGNVITKLVFFCLLATIGVMVGVILLEFRGSTDEETTSAVDSPWSVTLEKWVDSEADAHAHEEHVEEEHETEEHESGEHDHDEEHADDMQDKDPSAGILSLLGFGGSSEAENVEAGNDPESSDESSLLGGIMSLLPFGGSSDDTDVGEKEEADDGGGWFGFGSSKKEELEEAEEHDELEEETEADEDALDEEADEQNEEEDESQEEEEDEEQEEEEEIDEKEEEEEEEDSAERIRGKKYLRDASEEEDDQEETAQDDDDLEETAQEEQEEEEEENEEGGDQEPEQEEEEEDEQEEEEERDELDQEEQNNLSEPEEDEEQQEDMEVGTKQEDESEEELDEGLGNVSEEDENNLSGQDDDDTDNDDEDEERDEPKEEEEEEDDADSGIDDEDQEDNEQAIKNAQTERSEELFPEAIEALRREAEELAAQAKKMAEEKEAKPEEDSAIESETDSAADGEEETEGTGEDEPDRAQEIPPVTESKEEFHEERVSPVEARVAESSPPPPPPKVEEIPPPKPSIVPQQAAPVQAEEPAEESPVEDEEEVEEEEGGVDGEDEEESEDLEIDKDKFRELIAKYGQDTPESTDIEQSDDDVQKVEYSGGEESPGEEEEEESQSEAGTEDEQVPSDEELKNWTGIKKGDISKITKLDSESEGEPEEEEEEEEEESEDEPPPPPPPTTGRQRGGPKDSQEDYENAYITNDEDWLIRQELDRADEEFNYEKALTLYRTLLSKHPNSPRARYGLAKTYDDQAEKAKSNQILNLAITAYKDALEAPNIPDILFIKIAMRLIDRLRFRGLHLKAVDVHNQLIQKYNHTPEYRTDLAITYLMTNRLENARLVLKELLGYWPQDPTALAHYGLVLKLQGNNHGCIKYLEEGLASDISTTRDARLFFHLGDALSRVGREADAMKVYDKAVAYGLFRSRYQRSLYNVDRLTARPWWTLEETTYAAFFKLLEENWMQIREEGVKALNLKDLYKDEAEGLRDKGDWKQFELFARGMKIKKNCEVTPFTCSLVGSFEPAASCKRGQTKFSIMEGGTHVWPHCGPTNCRLRAHLGLIVPEGPLMRVATIKKRWEEGKVFVFDDSFEHEVWHNGTSLRLVLIVDVWHPELTRSEKLSMSAI